MASRTWGEAIPDVLFAHEVDSDGFSRTALEVELTYKKPAELDRKFAALSAMLAEDPALRVRWLFPGLPMAQHYERVWRARTTDVGEGAVTFDLDASLTRPL